MSYVDGYLLPIPRKNMKRYHAMAEMGRRMWMRFGALDYKECAADDLRTPCGTTFTKTLKLKRGETLVFAFVVFKSRAHRDQVNKKVMRAMGMEAGQPPAMPFDMKRMVYGGFKTFVGK